MADSYDCKTLLSLILRGLRDFENTAAASSVAEELKTDIQLVMGQYYALKEDALPRLAAQLNAFSKKIPPQAKKLRAQAAQLLVLVDAAKKKCL